MFRMDNVWLGRRPPKNKVLLTNALILWGHVLHRQQNIIFMQINFFTLGGGTKTTTRILNLRPLFFEVVRAEKPMVLHLLPMVR